MSSDAYPPLHLLIAGETVSASTRDTRDVVNPATGEVIGVLPCATPADLDDAMAAATEASGAWAATPAIERSWILRRAGDLLRERSTQIGMATTIEQGKPVAQGTIEARAAAEILDWFGQEARRLEGRVVPSRFPRQRDLVLRKPVGPVAAFTPWNFPITIPARKIGAALAVGCPVVIKPAEETPATGLALASALHDAGLPAGLVSVVFGDPATVSEHLIRHPATRKVTFTGSTAIGRRIGTLAAEGIKRVTLELGGHAPVIVFDDVDIDHVVELAVATKYRNAGQVCISPTRFYVQRPIFEEFADRFTQAARGVRVGNGLDPDVDMGPLANERRPPALEALVDDAVERGATVLHGGGRRAGPGCFFEPTVMRDLTLDARIMNDEPFGPVALLTPFDSVDDAMELANRLPYGLASYAFTNSLDRAYTVSERIEAGMLGINHFKIQGPETPFGGIKESGYGSEGGSEGLDDFLFSKLVSHA